jgi:serine/threonine protein kinase
MWSVPSTGGAEDLVERIGRYVVDRELGRGGMARAVLAFTDDGTPVVLKIPLHPDEETCGRLREEARVGIRVNHPNLIQTLDLVEHNGLPVLVVSYVDGVSVHALTQKGRVSADAVSALGAAVASALHAIHGATDEHGRSLQIVHRDVSVANILCTRDGDARLIDLGLARSTEALHKTQSGMLLGTLPYFAPELLEESPYSPASDMWAFGCVLFEAATGERLFAGRNEGAVVGKIMTGDPFEHPGWAKIAPGLAGVLQRLLVRDPALRLVDAREVERRLTSLSGTTGRQALGERVKLLMPKQEAPFEAPTFKETLRLYMAEDQVVPFTKDEKSGNWHGNFETLSNAEDLDRVRSKLFDFTEADAARQVRHPVAKTEGPDPFRPPSKRPEVLELSRQVAVGGASNHMAAPADPYPKAAKKRRLPLPSVAATLVIGVVGVGALFAWTRHREKLAEEAALAARAARASADQEIERLLAPPEDAPDCYRNGADALFIYTDAKGVSVVKERIEDVPKKFRRSAKCVRRP